MTRYREDIGNKKGIVTSANVNSAPDSISIAIALESSWASISRSLFLCSICAYGIERGDKNYVRGLLMELWAVTKTMYEVTSYLSRVRWTYLVRNCFCFPTFKFLGFGLIWIGYGYFFVTKFISDLYSLNLKWEYFHNSGFIHLHKFLYFIFFSFFL